MIDVQSKKDETLIITINEANITIFRARIVSVTVSSIRFEQLATHVG